MRFLAKRELSDSTGVVPVFSHALRPNHCGYTIKHYVEFHIRVRIGLRKADLECKNNLILLVIQHFLETILQGSFTMFC